MKQVNAHIIVADDNELYARSLADFFSSKGYRVSCVETGCQLLELIDKEVFDVAILDVVREAEDGLDIASALRQKSDIGIIILTGHHTTEQDQVEGLRVGADAYLSKSSDLSVVEATVQSVLRRLRKDQGSAEQKNEAEGWALDVLTWQLTTPTGNTLKMTRQEVGILKSLFKVSGEPVERSEILSELGKKDTEFARRNLETAVRRLRVKVEREIGESLPIVTVYGLGYAFTALGEIAQNAG
ncbi:response regulator transcription factor [Terasakiella sp. SH-1]|uniref:response regulator transcription factor n=1 Tax=Terasakiella sp. SH-1 TaxID=2560057 RepID=UPI0010734983|nr:response regulator transcription factor [Terasakiella sp. SH-1]